MAIRGENIWITGATSGIGQELAKTLADGGNTVLAGGRNEEALNQLAREHGVIAVPGDITASDAARSLAQGLESKVDYLDRIILNAGTCEYFDINAPDWDMMQRVMDVNYRGTIRCIEAGLPLLHKHRNDRGHLVAVGSQASRAPFPRAQAYGASKAAITYFMQALAVDLAGSGIDVTVVQPGFVDTPLTRKNDFEMPFLMSAQEAASLIVRRLQQRPLRLSFPRRLSALLALGEYAPALWVRHVAARLSRS